MAINLADIIANTPQLSQHDVVWLYGSQATGTATQASDYDLAVALEAETPNSFELIDDINHQLNSHYEQTFSVVDINKIPPPLALNIINDGKVLICNNDLRLRTEQQRIWSLWEEYKYEYERIQQTL